LTGDWPEFNVKMPRILSFTGILTDESGNKIHEDNHFRLPVFTRHDGTIGRVVIMNSHIHGISERKCIESGIPIIDLLDIIINRIKTYSPIIVGHNVEYDLSMIVVELVNELANISEKTADKNHVIDHFSQKINTYCTMEMGKSVCCIPYSSGKTVKSPIKKRGALQDVMKNIIDIDNKSEIAAIPSPKYKAPKL
jgi:DNA polymerase III epsilon subunit-like protein